MDASISKVQHSCHSLRYFLRNPRVSLTEYLKNKNLVLPGSRPVHTRWTAKGILRSRQNPARGGTLPSMISALNWKDIVSYGEMSCQPCCIAAERPKYIEKGSGIWLAHAAFPPPLLSLDLHSWHKLLLQCNLSSSTKFDKNSWVFCIFMCPVMCCLLERNQHPSWREVRARRICWEEPKRFTRSLPSLAWLAFYSFIIISVKHEWNIQPKLSSKRCARLLPGFKEKSLKFPTS